MNYSDTTSSSVFSHHIMPRSGRRGVCPNPTNPPSIRHYHMAGKWHAWTAVTIHRLVVQQLSHRCVAAFHWSSRKLAFDRCANKCLANANRPCNCSVLCLRPKSSLCSSPHSILDITSFGSADSVCRASNNGVGQFKLIFQVEGNIFCPIFSVTS